MKFRNKKTGEIKAFGNLQVYAEAENSNESQFLGNFNSFKQIFEYYEDYIPKEPIIKDEKVRKAVRAWAEVNDFEPDCKVRYGANSYSLFSSEASIEFNIRIKGLEHLKDYTIKELCGEEEE